MPFLKSFELRAMSLQTINGEKYDVICTMFLLYPPTWKKKEQKNILCGMKSVGINKVKSAKKSVETQSKQKRKFEITDQR